MKEKICGIYKITSPSGRIYVGQSNDINYRIGQYKRKKCKQQTILYRSINKYGWDKHVFEVLIECESGKLNEMEKYYVDFFKSFNSRNGMNLRDGGGSKGMCSDSTKERMSIAQRGNKNGLGRIMSLENKIKLIIASKNRIYTSAIRLNMSIAHLGYKHTKEQKEKISQSIKKNMTTEKRNSISIKVSKWVLNTENGVFYIGVKSAYESMGGEFKDLHRKLTGIRRNNSPFVYA